MKKKTKCYIKYIVMALCQFMTRHGKVSFEAKKCHAKKTHNVSHSKKQNVSHSKTDTRSKPKAPAATQQMAPTGRRSERSRRPTQMYGY